VYQASVLHSLSFDPFSFHQDGLAAPEVDVSRCQIGDALVVTKMVVVADEVAELSFQIAGQIVVFEQDAVLERLVPTLDLALGLGMVRRAMNLLDLLILQPFFQLGREVRRAVIAEQPGTMTDIGAGEP
jgi:hypothetical protein